LNSPPRHQNCAAPAGEELWASCHAMKVVTLSVLLGLPTGPFPTNCRSSSRRGRCHRSHGLRAKQGSRGTRWQVTLGVHTSPPRSPWVMSPKHVRPALINRPGLLRCLFVRPENVTCSNVITSNLYRNAAPEVLSRHDLHSLACCLGIYTTRWDSTQEGDTDANAMRSPYSLLRPLIPVNPPVRSVTGGRLGCTRHARINPVVVLDGYITLRVLDNLGMNDSTIAAAFPLPVSEYCSNRQHCMLLPHSEPPCSSRQSQ